MTRPPLHLVLLAALLAVAPLRGQDPALKDTFLQAKSAWATQGDRETATAKFSAQISGCCGQRAGRQPSCPTGARTSVKSLQIDGGPLDQPG